MAQAAQGNPKATMAAIEIRKNPQNISDILDKFYTAEGEEPTPEEEALIGQEAQQLPQQQIPQGEPDIASVLAGIAGGLPAEGGPVV